MQVLDVRDPDYRQDPYSLLSRLREAGPVCRVEPFGCLGILRYEHVSAAMKNPQLFSSATDPDFFQPPPPGTESIFKWRTLIGDDPPQHTRLRRHLARAFSLQTIGALEPHIAEITKHLLNHMVAKPGDIDFIGDLAMPLPVTVIAELLGIDPEQRLNFKRWTDELLAVRTVQMIKDSELRKKRAAETLQSCTELNAYLTDVIEARRQRPGNDLLSLVIQADDNSLIRTDEVMSLTRLLLIAGNETTTNLLGSAMLALIRHPEELRRLRRDPSLLPNAIEEVLRYDGPVIGLFRKATRDTDVAGEPVAAGKTVMCFFASANRDPRRFLDPDRFDITRDTQGHMAFGQGVHFCIGAPLARLEAKVALSQVLERFSDFELQEQRFVYLESFFLRGLKSLLLRCTPTKGTRTQSGSDAALTSVLEEAST